MLKIAVIGGRETVMGFKALGLEKPAVYGWSDGGILALMIEMAHPGTCGSIALQQTPDGMPLLTARNNFRMPD